MSDALLETWGDVLDSVPLDAVFADQALARLLLLARAAGVDASYLNQPLGVEDLRPEVEALVRAPGRAQVILRLGAGPAVPPTPRRPLEEVLLP